jgi:potassium efflux system protein
VHCLLMLSLLLLGAPAGGAEGEIDERAIREKIERVEADPSLDEERRAGLLAQLESTREQLVSVQRFRAKAAEHRAVPETAAQETRRFEALLAELLANPVDPDDLIASDATLEAIEGSIALMQSERRALAERRDELLEAFDGWPSRREAIQKRLGQLPGLIEEKSLIVQSPAETLDREVRRMLGQATLQALSAEQDSLQLEVQNAPAKMQVIQAERDWLLQALAQADQKLKALNSIAEAARSADAREKLDSVTAIQEELRDVPPSLEAFAASNRELARRLDRYSEELERARTDALQVQSQLETVQQDSALMHRRLEFAGRKAILGPAMVTRLDSLPNTQLIRRQVGARDDLIAELSLDYFNVDEELWAINARQRYLADRFSDVDTADPTNAGLVERLVNQRQQLLRDNTESLKSLIVELVENNESAGKLIALTGRYRSFLVGNLMWVRNFDYVALDTLYAQLTVMFSPANWIALPSAVMNGYLQHEWSLVLVLLLVLVFLLQKPLRSVYRNRLGQPALLRLETLWNIILCLLLSLMIVLPWPLALYLTGFFLGSAEPSTIFSAAAAPSFIAAAKMLYALLLIRLTIRPRSVGRRLLKWDSRLLDLLRRELDWAGPISILAALVYRFAMSLDIVASGGPLGAIATAVVAVTLITFSLRLLRGPLPFGNPAVYALRGAAVLGASILLMLLLGLLFAAETYLAALIWSIAALLVIKVLSDILERALLILRARLVRRTREELRTLEEGGEEAKEDVVDVVSLSEAHTKLLSILRLVAVVVALWLIWSPSLPAFNLLESVALWKVGDPSAGVDGLRTITLFDLFLGIGILVLTALIAKHLPSIVQLFLLEWAHISAGARYASGILIQYVVVAVGASLFFSTLGWDWSNLQWLVAALGVGIGFGLQEIVANLICGIIILFEQPVRVGDIITAGGAEGTVKKISARATVIQTFEGKEHLIPNKELITGQVINWSLTETAVRVVIPVGIAYGSDVRRALELLVEAAKEVALVLPDPEPFATFEDFGDNALVLWLRCFVAEERPRAWTELRTRINDKFNEAGIVIAFPQRDLHLDFAEALKVELTPGGA